MNSPLNRLSTRIASVALLMAVATCGVAVAEGMAPINAGSISTVDIPASSARSITLNIEDARFSEQSAGHLQLNAQGIDFRAGSLTSLHAKVTNSAVNSTLRVNEFNVDTQSFDFDTFELLNNRRFILSHPVQAAVHLRISEDNLNLFFSHPKTVHKLERAIQKQTGGLKLITFTQPKLTLGSKNRVFINLTAVAGNALAAPLKMTGKLHVRNHNLEFYNLKVNSGENLLPVDVTRTVQKELNKSINLKKLSDKDFLVSANSVAVSKAGIVVDGSATMRRLEFGKRK